MPLSKSFELTSGLLDEYEMTLSEVWFGKDPQYMEGKQTIFVIRGEAELDDEVVDDEHQVYYSLGDGWEPDDGGESATHGAGKQQFNQSSNMGRFIAAVVDCGKEVVDVLEARGTEAYDAATWLGLRFLFNRKRFVFKDRATGEEREYFVELPVEFLGEDGEVSPAPKKKAVGKRAKAEAKPTSRRRKTKEPEEEEEAPKKAPTRRRKTSKGDSELRQEVINFAAEWEEHTDFMAAVLDDDEFPRANDLQDAANEELLNDILDEDGEVWTASREIELEG